MFRPVCPVCNRPSLLNAAVGDLRRTRYVNGTHIRYSFSIKCASCGNHTNLVDATWDISPLRYDNTTLRWLLRQHIMRNKR